MPVSVLCAQLPRDLLAIAKFLFCLQLQSMVAVFYSAMFSCVYCIHSFNQPTVSSTPCVLFAVCNVKCTVH